MIKESLAADIIPYAPEHQAVFKSLNLEWLDAYGLTESHDLMVLNDPQGTIIDRGGVIYLAVCDDQVVGSAALMKEKDGVYELAKMSVAPAWRGKGISKLLIQECIRHARALNASRLLLFSNHRLTTAIALYEKYGFRHVPVTDSPFETADVRMELIL